jgi:hypothetical protein
MNSSLIKIFLAAPLVCWAIASCGGTATELETSDSNTNWLKKCELDSDCTGALSCLCGICSQPCGTTAECSRLSGASCAESASDECSDHASAGAMCVLACTSDADCSAGFECRSAQCVPDGPLPPPPSPDAGQSVTEPPLGPTGACNTVTWDQVWEAVEADLLQRDAEDRAFLRYVTLANKLGAGLCNQALDPYRQALSKALNGVSRDTQIRQPSPIPGDTETYRVDLRDYGLDDSNGPFISDGFQFVDGWELISSNDPFAVEFQGDQSENVSLLANAVTPLLFAESLIDVATSGSRYYDLVGIPETQIELEQQLSIDLLADDEQDLTVRGGRNVGGRDFVAERHEQAVGGLYYWQTADFGVRAGALFTDPLGPLRGEREVVYSLPNGLLGFALYDAAGQRLDESAVLTDPSEEFSAYRAVSSSLRRYAQGFAFEDQVRQDVIDNPIDYGATLEITDLLDRYPLELPEILDSDAQLFQLALARAGVPENAPEPITALLGAFAADVDIAVVAGDTLFPQEAMANEINRLDPALSGLDNGFSVDRDDWAALYVNTLCIVSVANENRPSTQACIDAGVLE